MFHRTGTASSYALEESPARGLTAKAEFAPERADLQAAAARNRMRCSILCNLRTVRPCRHFPAAIRAPEKASVQMRQRQSSPSDDVTPERCGSSPAEPPDPVRRQI